MKSEIINYMKNASRNWWTSLVVGILAVILSIWCLFTPVAALIALSYVFVIGFVLSGIFDIVFAISNRKLMYGWGWTLAAGIIDFLFGILLIALPLPVLTIVFVYFVGFWILFRSIWTIGVAVELNHYTKAGWLIAFGILSLLFSIFYLFSPSYNGVALIALASVAFLFYGVFRIYLSLQLRKLNKTFKELE